MNATARNVTEDRPTLSFDGRGINGPDEYRSRLATFTTQEAAAKWGPLFAASPDLLATLEHAQARLLHGHDVNPNDALIDEMRNVIAFARLGR